MRQKESEEVGGDGQQAAGSETLALSVRERFLLFCVVVLLKAKGPGDEEEEV